MTIKIATIGSCVTRDNFNSNINPYYKKFFNVVAHQNQTSIPSLMSEKVHYMLVKNLLKKRLIFKSFLTKNLAKNF